MNRQPTENHAERRHEVMFRLWNSYWIEHISEVFNRRMDTVINAVILTSGATVFAGSNFSWLSVHCGLTLLIISPLPFFRRGSRLPWHMKFIAIRHLFFPVCC